MRGCIHASILNNYKAQIISLTNFDFISILIVISFKKNFANPFMYILFASCYVSFLVFDSILTIRYSFPQLFTKDN
jgi:hypothetical protein